jgi:hypothetical protein
LDQLQVIPEGRFVDQGGQVIGIGLLEVGVIGVETTGPWSAVDVLLGFAGGIQMLIPLQFICHQQSYYFVSRKTELKIVKLISIV